MLNSNTVNQALHELTTIKDFIRWGASEMQRANLYFGHGTDNAWDEACWLVLHALQMEHAKLAEVLDAQLIYNERRVIVDLFLRRIKERIPAAYLTNKAWFADLPFYVDKRVLIPRSPFAEIIQQQFEPWSDSEGVKNVLDLCTGCGCIAIATAYALPNAKIDAVDLSKDALEVAAMNCQQHNMRQHVSLYHSDLFDALPGKRYDIIISNPPYVDANDFATIPAEYQHEPSMGLEAGKDGLDIVKRIVSQAKQYLTEQGILLIEVGNSAEAMIEQFDDVPFVWLEFEYGGHGVFLLRYEDLK